ncbi:MAG: GIY-YIG nuclease family protein [Patescibacteria group bacterium]
MPYVYTLKSKNFPKTYTGSTIDINRRIVEHNGGKNIFTRRYAPWVVIYKETFDNLSSARKREKYLKSAAGRRFIKQNNIIPR